MHKHVGNMSLRPLLLLEMLSQQQECEQSRIGQYLDLTIVSAGSKQPAVRAECCFAHASRVAFVCGDAGLSSDVPDLQGGLQRTRGKEVTKRMEVYAGACRSVPGQCSDDCKEAVSSESDYSLQGMCLQHQ